MFEKFASCHMYSSKSAYSLSKDNDTFSVNVIFRNAMSFIVLLIFQRDAEKSEI